jgi:hypothetical protein
VPVDVRSRALRGTGLDGWQWPTAWWGSVAAAIFVEGWFIWSAISESDFPLGIRLPGPGDLGPTELLAAFVVAGAAMITVLVIARSANRRSTST